MALSAPSDAHIFIDRGYGMLVLRLPYPIEFLHCKVLLDECFEHVYNIPSPSLAKLLSVLFQPSSTQLLFSLATSYRNKLRSKIGNFNILIYFLQYTIPDHKHCPFQYTVSLSMYLWQEFLTTFGQH